MLYGKDNQIKVILASTNNAEKEVNINWIRIKKWCTNYLFLIIQMYAGQMNNKIFNIILTLTSILTQIKLLL